MVFGWDFFQNNVSDGNFFVMMLLFSVFYSSAMAHLIQIASLKAIDISSFSMRERYKKACCVGREILSEECLLVGKCNPLACCFIV